MPVSEFRTRKNGMPGVLAVEASSDRVFAKHTHDEFGIGLIDRGAQKSLSGRGVVEAGAGDVITVNPGEVHDGMPLTPQGRSWRMLYFTPGLMSELVRDITGGREAQVEFRTPALRDERAARCFPGLYDAMTATDDLAPLRREERLLPLLALLGTGRGERGRAPAAVAAARQRIDDDPTAALTLAALAGEAGLSRFQFLRGFAAATGLTPHGYLVQRRVALARRLIGDGLTLADAAAASGFADQSHMTRTFVRTYGYTPGAWAAA